MRSTDHPHGESDVVKHRHGINQTEILKHNTHRTTQIRDLPLLQFGQFEIEYYSVCGSKEIFGEDAQDIIRKSIATVKDNFLNDYLVYIEGARRTEPKCIKLGWKFEFLRYDGGKRAGKIVLTREQKLNIYAGTELNEGKRNCWVGDSIIEDSGVANMYVEIGADEVSLKNVLSKMIPIEEFVDSQDSDLCFACKALNYRAVPDKWDGDRPLAVYVDWKLENRIMTGKIVLNQPLEHKGNEIGKKVQQILKQLGITEKNFSDIKKHLAPGTNVSE